MAKPLVSPLPSGEDLDNMDQLLDQLETATATLITLDPVVKRRLFRLGDKSEAFGRQALRILAANEDLAPPRFDLAAAQDTLQARERLRTCINRLEQLRSRMQDTHAAMGADIFTAARKAYRLLQIDGNAAGLESLKQGLAKRFRSGKPRKNQEGGAQD